MDVLKEAHRILKIGGKAVICESFRRWLASSGAGDDDASQNNTLLRDVKEAGFNITFEEGTTPESSDEVFQYIVVEKSF
jgi:ubiquinone/menaquinone biosynthesis C-methylase UbiE